MGVSPVLAVIFLSRRFRSHAFFPPSAGSYGDYNTTVRHPDTVPMVAVNLMDFDFIRISNPRIRDQYWPNVMLSL
jgi:hypothetical protein